MKYSVVFAASAALVAARPEFTNTSFDVVEGEPFTLTFTGCESGCTISLENGPSDDLQPVQDLTSAATGGSFEVNLDSLPSDKYAFKIVNNESGESNYSLQFDFVGTGEPPAETTSAMETMTSAVETTTVVETTTMESSTEMTTMTTMTSMTTETTEAPSTTETESETQTESETDSEETGEPTEVPDNSVGRLASPLALIAGAVSVMLFFN